MTQRLTQTGRSPSRLQRDLLPRIVEVIRAERLQPGARLPEVALARRLQVSRTPVRAALRHLAARGVVEWRPRTGFLLLQTAAAIPDAEWTQPAAVDQLCAKIAGDRLDGRLPSEASEAGLMRRYALTRPQLLKVLNKLAGVALVERKPGHGWLFSPVDDPQAMAESYAFRRLVEPAGLLEPTFRLDAAWARNMRLRHEAMLAEPWHDTMSVALFEMNAGFHEGLAAASGNRFLLLAVQQQTQLRRYANYSWRYGHARVLTSCREHLEILTRLEQGEREVAAALLRRHLEQASKVRHPACELALLPERQ